MNLRFIVATMLGMTVTGQTFQASEEFLEPDAPTILNASFPELPTSFDPLDGHVLQNMPIMLDLYASPLEFDPAGRYRSRILNSFLYSDRDHTIQFCLKRNQFFSDDSPIQIDDLAFNISRVAYFYPHVKHLKDIMGLKDWLKLEHPLMSFPSGLVLNRELNCLTIHFNSDQQNPFNMFTAAMHGIIPKSSVSLQTGKLKVSTPPFSGRYSLAQINARSYTLERRESIASSPFPKSIRVTLAEPVDLEPLLDSVNKNTVVLVNRTSLRSEAQRKIIDEFRGPPPHETMIEGALFNTRKNHLFSDKRLRQYFAAEMRKSVKELGDTPSGSLFTPIQPGFIPLSTLQSIIPIFSAEEKANFLAKLRKHPPIAGYGFSNTFFQRIFERTTERLGISKKSTTKLARGQLIQEFLNGTIDIRESISIWGGLESADGPRLLFTQTMFAFSYYNFLNNNKKIRNALEQIYQPDPFTVNLKGVENLNQLLFEDASLSVYRNLGQEQYVKKDSTLQFSATILKHELSRFFTEAKE